MTDKLFNKLWKDALNQPSEEMYLSEYGYPDWFDEISQDPSEVIEVLRNIHRVSKMTFKDILKEAGLSQTAFSEKFCISLRTVQHWNSGDRKCPDYLRLLICKYLGILEV